MRENLDLEDRDIESMVAQIGAPPAAPMSVVRQMLERQKDTAQLGLLPRLLGAFSPKAGQ
ncbi:MAG: hypothetical protein IKD58_13240 [Loktanella sp.]|nr:hypothetical protein [Loktanella sp.]